ncbi:MAG: hypothetical protein LBU23_00520 [Planctomycetota bacterium]|jgi:hypothetical protein|nr:hypothetical protein [Planctomycetota bacterium]
MGAKTKADSFPVTLAAYARCCLQGDRPAAIKYLARMSRIIGAPDGGPPWSATELSAAIRQLTGHRLPPDAAELAAVLIGNRAMAAEQGRELVF